MLFIGHAETEEMTQDDYKYKHLDKIDTPADLKKLSVDELPELCDELRHFIIYHLADTPGHLGSSLGAVEIIVALHYVMDTPKDQLLFDVGHQAYAHKILTGRKNRFNTLRQLGGLSGFPTPQESQYDGFVAGHASNSISAGLGISVAQRYKAPKDKVRVAAVIGDGAMSGGLAFEGLNNVATTPNDLLIVLNDNHMAIDPIKGGMSQYLLDITTSKTYNNLRYKLYKWLRKLGFMSDKSKHKIQRTTNSIKSLLSRQQFNIFESLSIRYFGPVDGHDIKNLVRIFNEIKDYKGPKVVHCVTQKGKGYIPAELNPTIWHAPGKFDPDTGRRITCKDNNEKTPLFQDVFGETLLQLARKNKKIVTITPAMPSGSGLGKIMAEMPDRCYDVGIAEGHAVTFSAGLAKAGMKPFCVVYSTFLQRAYDNIIHDAAILNLPMVICIDRAGLVGNDGTTHHGYFDITALRSIPDITIAAPYDEIEMRNMMYTAQTDGKGLFVIRYPRGRSSLTGQKSKNQNNHCHTWMNEEFHELEIGKGRMLKDGNDVCVISIGTMGQTVAKAIEEVEKKEKITVAHYDLRFIKPIDMEMIKEIAGRQFKKVITVEDGMTQGGAGTAVMEALNEIGATGINIKRIGLPDKFIGQGNVEELRKEEGLDEAGIEAEIKN